MGNELDRLLASTLGIKSTGTINDSITSFMIDAINNPQKPVPNTANNGLGTPDITTPISPIVNDDYIIGIQNLITEHEPWIEGSLQKRRELLKSAEKLLPDYLKQFFGDDTTQIYSIINRVIPPLKTKLSEEYNTTYTIPNRLSSITSSAVDGVLNVKDGFQSYFASKDAGYVDELVNTQSMRMENIKNLHRILMTDESLTDEERSAIRNQIQHSLQELGNAESKLPKAKENLDRSTNEYLATLQKRNAREVAKQENNPLILDQVRRSYELNQEDKSILFNQIKEQKSLFPAVEGIVATLPSIMAVLVPSAIGTVVGSPAVGGAVATATSTMILGADVSQNIIQTVNDLSEEDLKGYVDYDKLIKNGLSDTQARLVIANKVIDYLTPYILGLGAVSSVATPEKLFLPNSLASRLLLGGTSNIAVRAMKGLGVGALEEGFQEGTQKFIEQVGLRKVLGDESTALFSGVLNNAVDGAIIGGLLGGAGSVTRTPTSITNTNNKIGTDIRESVVNTPDGVSDTVIQEDITESPGMTPETISKAEQYFSDLKNYNTLTTQMTSDIKDIMGDIYGTNDYTNTDNLFKLVTNLNKLSVMGVPQEYIDNIIGAIQSNDTQYKLPNNINLHKLLYNDNESYVNVINLLEKESGITLIPQILNPDITNKSYINGIVAGLDDAISQKYNTDGADKTVDLPTYINNVKNNIFEYAVENNTTLSKAFAKFGIKLDAGSIAERSINRIPEILGTKFFADNKVESIIPKFIRKYISKDNKLPPGELRNQLDLLVETINNSNNKLPLKNITKDILNYALENKPLEIVTEKLANDLITTLLNTYNIVKNTRGSKLPSAVTKLFTKIEEVNNTRNAERRTFNDSETSTIYSQRDPNSTGVNQQSITRLNEESNELNNSVEGRGVSGGEESQTQTTFTDDTNNPTMGKDPSDRVNRRGRDSSDASVSTRENISERELTSEEQQRSEDVGYTTEASRLTEDINEAKLVNKLNNIETEMVTLPIDDTINMVNSINENPNYVGNDSLVESKSNVETLTSLFSNMGDTNIDTPPISSDDNLDNINIAVDATSLYINNQTLDPEFLDIQPLTSEEAKEVVDYYTNIINSIMYDPLLISDLDYLQNGDGTFSNTLREFNDTKETMKALNDMASKIEGLKNTFSDESRIAKNNLINITNEIVKYPYPQEWIMNNYSRWATSIKSALVDSTAHFTSWIQRFFSASIGNADQTLLQQLFNTTGISIKSIQQKISIDYLDKIEVLAVDISKRLDIDKDIILSDLGKFYTALHSKESLELQQQRLQNELQEALISGKQDLVEQAETNLNDFLDRINNENSVSQFPIEGGRSHIELDNIIANTLENYSDEDINNFMGLFKEAINGVVKIAVENSVFSDTDIANFRNFNYYVPLSTNVQLINGNPSDATIYTPLKVNYRREGSIDPAINGWESLNSFSRRIARNAGMSKFGIAFNESYELLLKKAESDEKADIVVKNGRKYVYGLARIPIDGMYYNNAMLKNMTSFIVNVPTIDQDNNSSNKRYAFIFNEDTHLDEHRAVQSVFNKTEGSYFSNTLSDLTRTQGKLFTTLKPLFPPLNMVRDMIERSVLSIGRDLVSKDQTKISGVRVAGRMLATAMNPNFFMNHIIYQVTGKSPSPSFNALMETYKRAGLVLASNFKSNTQRNYKESLFNTIYNILPKGVNALSGSAKKALEKTIGTWANIWYQFPAVAQFKALQGLNLSEESIVDNVRVLMDLQRSGTLTSKFISPLVPFVNSITQTGANAFNALGLGTTGIFSNHSGKKDAGKRALRVWSTGFTTTFVISSLLPMIKISMGDGDDELGTQRLDSMSLSMLSTFLPIPTGNGSFVKLPLGFGIVPFFAGLAVGMDRVSRGKATMADVSAELLVSFARNIVPINTPEFNFKDDPFVFLTQSFTPSIFMPIVQVATNKNYFGTDIVSKNYDKQRRNSDTAKMNTAEIWKDTAKILYDYTGLDFFPEQIKTVWDGYFTGILTLTQSFVKSDPLYKDPMYKSTRDILGNFWTSVGATGFFGVAPNQVQGSYYRAKKFYDEQIKILGIYDALKDVPKNRTKEEHTRLTLSAVGLSLGEVEDYIKLESIEKALRKLDSDFKKSLDGLDSKNLSREELSVLYDTWFRQKYDLLYPLSKELYFYKPDSKLSFVKPNNVSEILRNN